ncbi:P-type DNA transfer ATPase VirB11 [Ideonella sp. DXS29W]|uniref:Type IV secretion system protein n=1 Tax=Ideonella lacteola TaxID=2984193 RepID=A0ABU9BZL0_9BURK
MNAPVEDFLQLPADATVNFHLQPIAHFLCEPGVTEICVNRPGEVFVEKAGAWQSFNVPQLSFEHCLSLAGAVATLTAQHTSERDPLLGATLPGNLRVQFCQPGATQPGVVAICIRRPSDRAFTLADFDRAGLFSRMHARRGELRQHERELLELKSQGRFVEFLQKAVQCRQTIVVAGKTGSGKTTFMKALIELIALHERLITIEDANELELRSHRNKVHLLYSKNGQGASSVTPKQLLEACLRLRPDRILLAEVRGEEAYYFLRLAASGHPGSITSLHAGSCELAFEQLSLMVRESPAGGGMTMAEIGQLARDVVDIVIHLDDHEGRHITGIHYDPEARLRREAA